MEVHLSWFKEQGSCRIDNNIVETTDYTGDSHSCKCFYLIFVSYLKGQSALKHHAKTHCTADLWSGACGQKRGFETLADETCGMSLCVSACLSDSQAFDLDQNIRRDDALVSHLTHSLQFKEDSLGFPSLFILRDRNYRVPAGHCVAGYVIQRQILE